VLNTHVNPLLDDSVANLLVDLNTNGTRSHIPDHSSSPMVESERHALVDGGIGLDVHIIADFVGSEVFREGHWSMLSEGLCKEFPRPSPITKGVRHLCVEVAMNYRGEERKREIHKPGIFVVGPISIFFLGGALFSLPHRFPPQNIGAGRMTPLPQT